MYRVSPLVRGPFRVPCERTWSKQHPRIRTPRPLVDRFNLGRMHPNKEWWRERRVAPATFMGFPDVAQAALRGGSLYTEQMDAPTLSVIVDRCVSEKIFNLEFWEKFSWRTQQIINTTSPTEVAYLFRGFSRANGFWDSHLVLSLLGRIDWVLESMEMGDLAAVLQGFHNPKFREPKYEKIILTQIDLLLTAVKPGNWSVAELACIATNLVYRGELTAIQKDVARKALDQLSSAAGDFCDLSVRQIAGILTAMSDFSHPSPDLLYALMRELQEPARAKRSGEDALKILRALVCMHAVEPLLLSSLAADWYDQIHSLTPQGLVEGLQFSGWAALAESGVIIPNDWRDILLRRVARETYTLTPALAQTVIECLEPVVTGWDPLWKATVITEARARLNPPITV